MHAEIIGSTLFNRNLGNNSGFLMGVLCLDRSPEVIEGQLYAVNLEQKTLLLSESVTPSGLYEPYECYSMDGLLKSCIWPSIVQDEAKQLNKWFYAMVLPLSEVENHVFIYAAVNTMVFPEDNDSWHGINVRSGRWDVLAPLCESRGHNALTLCRSIYWPINGDSFLIEPCPLQLVRLQKLFKEFYLGLHRDQAFDKKTSKAAAQVTARSNGFSEALIESLASSSHSIYSDDEYRSILFKVESEFPSSHERVIPAQWHKDRGNALRRAISEYDAINA